MSLSSRLTSVASVLLAIGLALCRAQEQVPPAAPRISSAATLKKWIDALSIAESGNRPWLVHRDRNGELYYGCLQFHEKTFRTYIRRFRLLPHTSSSEVMDHIYDCALQKRLAALMIRKDPNNWKHWKYTVEERIGMPPVPPPAPADTSTPSP